MEPVSAIRRPDALPLHQRPSPAGLDVRAATAALHEAGLNRWLAQSLAQRGVADHATATGAYAPAKARGMLGLDAAVARLRAAIRLHEQIFCVADYDADGCTAAVVTVTALRAMGATIDFAVPNRFIHGYGLTPGVVDLVRERAPNTRVIVTVDNGIASNAGVAHANSLGIDVVVTDHHLAGAELPDACAIVDPNQPGCPFPAKNTAGCGVILYVLTALRNAFRMDGDPAGNASFAALLDAVALGTVADVVPLDANNRWLVNAGLRRIRGGAARPGLAALFDVSRREAQYATASDFAFSCGPRVNSAGRLADMTTGIRCLLTRDAGEAVQLAGALASLNDHRRELEAEMREIALDSLDAGDPSALTRVAFDERFHEGVVGIVASRIKDRDGAPAVVFAPASGDTQLLKGSARGVAGMNLRDALDRANKLGITPEHTDGLLEKFGGHAMAAGLTLRRDRLPQFKMLFEQAVQEALGGVLPTRSLLIDGDLPNAAIEPATAKALNQYVWGTAFEEPLWRGEFNLTDARPVGKDQNHVKMTLQRGGVAFNAIQFFREDVPAPGPVEVVYRLGWSVWNGRERAEIVVKQAA